MKCGILFGGEPFIQDEHGCGLDCGHAGPHEFTDKSGDAYRWETDWDCDCEHCLRNDGDYCTVYWKSEEKTQS